MLDLLGLAARAGSVVAGTERVRAAVRKGGVGRVLVAADTAPAQQSKLIPLLEARGVPYHIVLSRAELGGSLGREPVAAVALTNPSLQRRIAELLAALPSA